MKKLRKKNFDSLKLYPSKKEEILKFYQIKNEYKMYVYSPIENMALIF